MVTFKKMGLKMRRGPQEKEWTVYGPEVQFTRQGNKGQVMSAYLEQNYTFNKGKGWVKNEN